MSVDETREPIQVVLSQTDSKIACRVTWPDDDTTDYDLRSLSMHRAKREIRAWLARDGYQPVDRWSRADGDGHRIVRHFKQPPADDRLAPLVR
jgi:hypothetical protein